MSPTECHFIQMNRVYNRHAEIDNSFLQEYYFTFSIDESAILLSECYSVYLAEHLDIIFRNYSIMDSVTPSSKSIS